ncbi:hypothetical protein Egran_05707 [Elaphomyces granulatus]|uniref:Uncharacterized protein n=1 Tax=Elaphomyces granulatus TaxID=519963 RepID=A0A232LQZ8_9EURO|nr:hypothetical protein Egran_05707 [Elaphomyces granulatus]
MASSSLSPAKTLIVPALISLAIYIVLSYLIIPFFRRYHQRYAQYLPLNSISTRTSSIRERAAEALMHFVLPSMWRRGARLNADPSDAISIYDEEGEIMVGMDIDPSRREALERRRSLASESQVRLSRELEEGFMDDSEEESEERDSRPLR